MTNIRAVSFLLLTVLTHVAVAEPCAGNYSVEQEFSASTNVVAAEAKTVRTEFVGHPLDHDKPREVQIVEWEVLESWKGQRKPRDWFKTRTVINASDHGRAVAVAEAYLLYQIDPKWISTCGRTTVLKHAIRDIPHLYRLSGKTPDGT